MINYDFNTNVEMLDSFFNSIKNLEKKDQQQKIYNKIQELRIWMTSHFIFQKIEKNLNFVYYSLLSKFVSLN